MRAAELLFRHKVFAMLKMEGLLSDERVKLMLSWRHSGFSVDASVRVDAGDTKALERVARYILRPPVSLERLSWHEATGEVSYTAKSTTSGHSQTLAEKAFPNPLEGKFCRSAGAPPASKGNEHHNASPTMLLSGGRRARAPMVTSGLFGEGRAKTNHPSVGTLPRRMDRDDQRRCPST